MHNGKNDPRERNNPAVYQELQHLRGEVERLKKMKGEVRVALPGGGIATTVEHRLDPRALVALRDLLVACENFFGPEEGKPPFPMPRGLEDAMKAATVFVRRPKKP